MYCEKCGSKAESKDDLFCGSCGTPFPKSEVSATSEINVRLTRPLQAQWKSMSRVAKRNMLISGATLVVLIGGYMIAQSLTGLSSPDKLQVAFAQAIRNKDTDQLAKLIDPSQKELLDPKVLKAFKDALNDQTTTEYLNLMQLAVEQNTTGNRATPPLVQIVPVKTWMGTSYRVHIFPAQVSFKEVPGDTIKCDVSGITSVNGKVDHLIPADYNFKVTYSNAFGSETVNSEFDLTQENAEMNADKSAEFYLLDPSKQIKNKLTLNLSSLDVTGIVDLQYTLNGKPLNVTANDSESEVTIFPVPTSGKLGVQATVLGVPVKSEYDYEVGNAPVKVIDALSKGVAEKALDLLYTLNLDWTQMVDGTKSLSQIQGLDPQSDLASQFANDLKSYPKGKKMELERVIADFLSVQINEDSIRINDQEDYKDLSGKFKDDSAYWTYTLKQSKDQGHWWATDTESSWPWPTVDGERFLIKSSDTGSNS